MRLCAFTYYVVAGLTTDCAFDIVFVLDRSASIHPVNFQSTKDFLADLVARLDINSNSTRVGLVAYSTRVETSFYLNTYFSASAVQSAIRSLPHSGGSTNTAGALAYVRTTMLTSSTGARSNIPNIVVVLTDGQSDFPPSTLVSVEMLLERITMLRFLADRNNGRAYAVSVCLPPVCLSVCNVCIVAKRCVLQQKLLLTAYKKSYMRNPMVP